MSDQLRIRARWSEFLNRDATGKSDYGESLRKATTVGGWSNWPQVPLYNQDVKLIAPGLAAIVTGYKTCACVGFCDNENLFLSKDIRRHSWLVTLLRLTRSSLMICSIAIEHGHRKFVSFPITNNAGSFQFANS